MIYVCIPAREEAETIGLVLWKIRKVFKELGREYQLLVADDGSRDATASVLRPYANVLPLTVETHTQAKGYPATVEVLARMALERTDRPKRDCAVFLHADFKHDPERIPDMVRRIDSGADLVVGEASRVEASPSRATRLVRWAAPLLIRGVRIPGVRDVVSGFMTVRLSCLRLALRDRERLLEADGWAANAELIARLARQARRVDTVPIVERYDRRHRASRSSAWQTLRQLRGARQALRGDPLSAARRVSSAAAARC